MARTYISIYNKSVLSTAQMHPIISAGKILGLYVNHGIKPLAFKLWTSRILMGQWIISPLTESPNKITITYKIHRKLVTP